MPDLATPRTDPFLYDAERLTTLASEPIVRRGIAYFKENRVTDLGWDGARVWSAVDGSRPGRYQVELSMDEDSELIVDCDCPFDWEPACKHAVATLLAYGARQDISEVQADDAASAAVEARVKRGRSEVEVKHVSGDRWLGTWEARSMASAAEGRPPYRVQIRSVSDPINHCTCPDFAVNRLGTCKHIEAVRHRLRKQAPKTFERYARQGPPTSVVHLEWGVPDAPRIRVRRAAGGAPAWLDGHFDGDGFLRGPLLEAFPGLERAARGRDDVILADEVEAHARRLVEEGARRVRAEALADTIRRSGGLLPGVDARLYPYQVEGVAFLAAAGRALLADDRGLGKTLQAIAAASVLREHEGVRRALIVCPASLKHQWSREVRRFTGVDAVVVEGPPAARGALYRQRAPFTIVNYELVLRDADPIRAELVPDLLILDEAQRIRNWRTKTAAAVKSIETPFAFVLTGTPLENRLEDLYSVMQVVDPRVLGPLWRYLLDFHVTDDAGRVLGYRNLAELRRRLAPVMLRRDRALVREQLPERTDVRLDVKLDRRQRALHDDAMATAGRIAQMAKKRPLTPTEEHRLMAALQNARMACDAAGLVDKESEGSPKLDELADLLEELCVDGGHKVVVFSQWERMTRMAEGVARKLGLGVLRLHGGVPTHRRGALLDRFRDDPEIQLFISTDAGGVGLNLQAASAVVNLDVPWSPAVLEQRIARVHRLGQGQRVQAVLMVARNSYEERVAGLVAAKRELFRNVVTDEATEDVVGVSKKMVEAVITSLDGEAEEQRQDAAGETTSPAGGAGTGMEPVAGPVAEALSAEDRAEPRVLDDHESLAPILSALQSAVGDGIERVVAMGGGLVVVAERVDAAMEQRVAALEAGVPLAVVEARSWAALSRLGSASPVAGARVLLDRQRAAEPAPAAQTAERKLRAAELLADGGERGEALELATSAMLHAAAAAAGAEEPPQPGSAAVWLYSELVPRGVMEPEQAASIGRCLALAGAPEVPPELLASVIADARGLVHALG